MAGADKPYFAVTWGETMMRLSPPAGYALEGTSTLQVLMGGAESNMAVALARLGRPVSWTSRLPDNPVGRAIVNAIKQHGVDVSQVLWAEPDDKAGVLFIETGQAPRTNTVVYDRKGSAVSQLKPGELDEAHLASGEYLFLTGITPALSEGCRESWLRSARVAGKAGCKVAVDVNYRGKLWSFAEARACLEEAFPLVDVLFCGMGDAQSIFGMPADPEAAARAFAETYKLPLVVLTLGADGALAYDGKAAHRAPCFPTDVLDRIGAGDAFAAGFLFGYSERDIDYGLRCGNASAALKQTYRGDYTWATHAEVVELAESQAFDPRRVVR